MTTAASVAFGIMPSSGASSSIVATAVPAVTSDAFCDRPPAARTTAVCDVPPPAGIAPNSAPPRLAAPVATSSRFASMRGSPGRMNARPAAIVSVKLISAIPSAPGTSCWISARSGSVSDGKPCGMCPTVETPSACRPRNHVAAIPPPTATSGAGECGHSRSMPINTTNVATATASVISEVSGTCATTLTTSAKNPCLVMWMPMSFGTWSSTITRPIPALNPVRTGVDMKFATKPSFRSLASMSIAPTSSVSVAVAVTSFIGSPSGTTSPSSVPARIASVVVELTLNTRDVPSSA